MVEKFTQEEWEICLKVLNALRSNPLENPDNQNFKTLITSIYKQAKKVNKREILKEKKVNDFNFLKNTTIVNNAKSKTTQFGHIEKSNIDLYDLKIARKCYCCNIPYTKSHFFYHKLCPDCSDYNYNQRSKCRDFSNYNVVITGGRVKIGYATVLKFLRANANVILTSRFPALAFEQLSKEDDYETWRKNLIVYGLDLRSLKAVQQFINFCNKEVKCVDILVNNAAQTIKYPVEYYKPLIVNENNLLLNFKAGNLIKNETTLSAHQNYLSQINDGLDVDINRFGQPIDFRDKNSWNSTLTEIELEELLEVNLINHISPYQLISGLKSAMIKSDKEARFIINVTSSEGQFSYSNKNIFHPHTNMTKAALNMLTRTSAQEFIKNSIFMNSVDVGWISTGVAETKREQQFADLKIPPLDPVDGAMRIIHPINEILNGNKSLYGVLLKNYKIVEW